MNLFAPLFAADIGDVVKVLALLLIVVIPLIRQLIAKVQQIPPPNQRPIPPRPAVPDVVDEIEAFMRRAVEREPAKPKQPAVVQASAAKPVQAEVVVDRPVGGRVTKHVQTYLDREAFDRRESELGKEVAEANRQMGQHLEQVFDHHVSTLESAPGEAASAPAAYTPPDLVGAAADIPDTFATGLLELITNPDSLRQAIVLSEILHRPEERWT